MIRHVLDDFNLCNRYRVDKATQAQIGDLLEAVQATLSMHPRDTGPNPDAGPEPVRLSPGLSGKRIRVVSQAQGWQFEGASGQPQIGPYDYRGSWHWRMGEFFNARSKTIGYCAQGHSGILSKISLLDLLKKRKLSPNSIPMLFRYMKSVLQDGSLYFTMKEVKGLPFGAAIKMCTAVQNNRWQTAAVAEILGVSSML